MSIRTEQTNRVLEDIVRALYSTGMKPTLNDILSQVSLYFSQHPAGLPLSLPTDYIRSEEPSDVDKFNLILAHLSMNLDVLYAVCLQQVDEALLLSASLISDLELLKSRRAALDTLVDDYLLSQFNTDGYYLSISDTFNDSSLTDFTMTSAYVDTVLGAVTLPIISSLSNRLAANNIGTPSIDITATASGVTSTKSFKEIAPWRNATDSLINTVWEIQVETDTPSEVIAVLTIPLGDANKTVELSRIDFDPYGIVEVQAFMELGVVTTGDIVYQGFGGKIETSQSRMVFIDQRVEAARLRITLRKTNYDYYDTSTGTTKYRYIFGCKDLVIQEQIYDSDAVFVSQGLQIPPDLQKDMVIDAVSLSVDCDLPTDTDITYYIAEEPDGGGTVLEDFDWKLIVPLGDDTNNLAHVVRFDGAQQFEKFIRAQPQGNDLQLIPADSTNSDISQRNPSSVIIPGTDTYRLCQFDEDFLPNTMTLDEGIDTVRIYHTTYSADAVKSLSWWSDGVNANTFTTTYGRIDTGNEFFYGGDVGESGRSIYAETYLDSLDANDVPILLEVRKSDPNSQTWSVRVFLNGREIGWLPGDNSDTTGNPINKLVVPWLFQQGLNHIGLLINIPSPTSLVANPYIGTLELMGEKNLFDYGTVKLASWNYVDFFTLKNNQIGNPETFSVYNGEIVSRRNPTSNFRLGYMKSTQTGPLDIRLRADLSRSVDNSHVSPKFNSYRLKFSYGAVGLF